MLKILPEGEMHSNYWGASGRLGINFMSKKECRENGGGE